MESWEAIRLAVGTDNVKVAKRLGRSTSLIHKWCEPASDFSDSGALNPLDRLEMVMEVALREGRPARDALAPIYYLAQRFDGMFLPPVPKSLESADFARQLCKVMKETGEAVSEAAEALEDGVLSAIERRQTGKALHEAIAELSVFLRMIEEG